MEKEINAQEVQVNAADGSIVDSIESKIFNIRGKQVMLDRDLAVHHLKMLVCARSASIQWDLI